MRLGAGGVAPEEGVPVDDLAHRRQLRPRLQRQHLPADQHRLAGVARERDGPQHRIGLQQDVVVHVEDLLALGVERLVHDAGVAAGAAEVGLVDDAQLVAEHRRRLLEARRVAHLLGALVGQDHGDHGVEDERVLADRGEGGDAVGGPVERGHADGDGRAAPAGLVGVPAALDEREVAVVGGEVEPVPAAVLERPQVQLQVDGVLARALQHHAAHEDRGAVGLGAVDVDPARAAQRAGAAAPR